MVNKRFITSMQEAMLQQPRTRIEKVKMGLLGRAITDGGDCHQARFAEETLKEPPETSMDTTRMAPPSVKLLCAVSNCENYLLARLDSVKAKMMNVQGYKHFGLGYLEKGAVLLVLRATDSATVELHTLISYPDRQGNGSTTMERLCAIADDLSVTIWLNAQPYGSDRVLIPLDKLIRFYRTFGFFRIRQVRPEWINGFHRWDNARFDVPMLRNPSFGPPTACITARRSK